MKQLLLRLKQDYFLRIITFFAVIAINLLLVGFVIIQSINARNAVELNTVNHQKNFESYVKTLNQNVLTPIELLQQDLIFSIIPYNQLVLDGEDNPFISDNDKFTTVLPYQKQLNILQKTIPYLTSIDMYSFEHDTYISSNKSIYFHVSDRTAELENSLPLALLSRESTTDSIIGPVKSGPSSLTSDICIRKTYPFSLNSEDINLVSIISVSPMMLYDVELDRFSLQEPHSFLIMNANGTIIFDSSSYSKEQSSLLPASVNLFSLYSRGIDIVEDDDTTLKLLFEDNHSGLVYAYIYEQPTLLSKITEELSFGLIWLISMMIVSFLLAYTFSKILYKPVSDLVKDTKHAFQTTEENDSYDEFQLIHSTLSSMQEHIVVQTQNLQETIPVILHQLANSILNSEFYTTEEVNPLLSKFNYCLTSDQVFLFIVQPETSITEKIEYEDKSYLYLYIEGVVNQVFTKEEECDIRVLSHISLRGFVVFLVCSTEEDYPLCQSQLQTIIQQTNKQLNIKVNIATSELYSDLSLTNAIYHEVESYLLYKFLYGYENIFTPDLISTYNSNVSITEKLYLTRIKELLAFHKYEECKGVIDEFYQGVVAENQSLLYTINISNSLLSIISEEYTSNNIKTETKDSTSLFKTLSNLKNISECTKFFHNLIEQLADQVSIKQADQDLEFIEGIRSYIKENYADCTLNSTAEHFKMSTGHLSRIFKKHCGVTFSDYIIDIKLTIALELLTTTSMQVTQIAQQIGYYNITYFNKIFKQKFNTTPSQYRKSHLTQHASDNLE